MNKSVDYYVYVNGFWSGFMDKTDANHIEFFENIFKKTKISNYTITQNINEANVLFESLFAQSLVNYKNWRYKIHYSGESTTHNFSDYDIVLCCNQTNGNVIDVPLFTYYIHGNNFLDKLINRPIIKNIPSLFCCFIVSNPNCQIRNEMFKKLNTYKKVDSYGHYANNMGSRLIFNYWSENYRHFLSNYKFIICFENSKSGTYSTEKIVNSYLSGPIPIYWSSPLIKNVFNGESMLFLEDETHGALEILIDKIKELDNDDAKYLEFVNRPIFNNNMQYWYENYTIEKIAEKMNHLLN